ncbi:HIT family protein [Niallia circulans]|jgi:diadenosine tetraphosphate (Ap4A) HIT family hydrolase|uniref:Diadenosine tetraphosphate hydrolase n=2 Tax=Bacillaceae TaxID=186817 RepID=A0A268FIR7_NIACI|nr:HIT family protein [Niallia circulans]AYV74675.1 HIT family protein [Niallia circulans]NRG29932.1 HIT family protein [Niallia circulans]PAD85273.1 diadenosine tetraphosphate hydrolase [Niallia circulans]QJX64803.1 HIT family protein [Niallia circulans]
MIKKGTNKYFVKELETGYIVIGDHQYFKGYTLFLCKEHKNELHELDSDFKEKFLVEMSRVSEAVYKAFKPIKLNYELLGNGDSHMHWHIFPRSEQEPNPTHPVWWTPRDQMYAENVKPNAEELSAMKKLLVSELDKIMTSY